jgi:hypothetical protein
MNFRVDSPSSEEITMEQMEQKSKQWWQMEEAPQLQHTLVMLIYFCTQMYKS